MCKQGLEPTPPFISSSMLLSGKASGPRPAPSPSEGARRVCDDDGTYTTPTTKPSSHPPIRDPPALLHASSLQQIDYISYTGITDRHFYMNYLRHLSLPLTAFMCERTRWRTSSDTLRVATETATAAAKETHSQRTTAKAIYHPLVTCFATHEKRLIHVPSLGANVLSNSWMPEATEPQCFRLHTSSVHS